MTDNDSCEFKPMSFGAWLRCGVCWHTKAGAVLVVLGGLILWFLPQAVFLNISAGRGMLYAGAVLLIVSLAKDLWILARRRKPGR